MHDRSEIEPDETLLLERERELSVLTRALDRLMEGHGAMLMVAAPAGIGKTRLLAEAADLGRERTVAVRAARAGQLEREMPFAVARQLLEPLLERADEPERSRLLSGSAGLSLIAFGQADPGDPNAEVDPFAAQLSDDLGYSSIGGVELFEYVQGFASSSPPSPTYLDNLQLGDSWDAVAEVPEPQPFAALAVAMLTGICLRRRRARSPL